MELFLLFLLLGLFMFLFVLHSLTREDYGLLRRNISMEQLFNVTFLSLFSGIILSRAIYALFHLNPFFLNPLVFFAIPYYSGLSLFGGVVGVFGSLYLLCLKKKYPWKKFFDFFSIAASCALPLVGVGTVFLHQGSLLFPILVSSFLYGVIGVVSVTVLYKRIVHATLPDGITGVLFLFSLAFIYLIERLFLRSGKDSLFFPESIAWFVTAVITFGLLIYLSFIKKK